MLANNLSKIFRIGLLRLFDSSAQIPITCRGFPEEHGTVVPDNLVGEAGALMVDALLLSILLGSRLVVKLYAGV